MKIRLPIFFASMLCLLAVAAYLLLSWQELAHQNGTVEAASSDITIYNDQLQSGFMNWSWSGNINLSDTSNPNSGSSAIAFTPNSWGGLYLHTDTAINASDYDSLQFSLRATQSSQKFAVGLYDENNQLIQNPTPLTNVGGDPTIGSYKQYTVSLGSLNPASKTIKGIVIQDVSGQDQPVVYVDDITLKAKQIQPTPTLTLTPTIAPTVSPSPVANTSTLQSETNAVVMYADSLQSGFANWSWGSSVDLNATSQVKSGSKAIAFTVQDPWAGLYLHTDQPIDTAAFTTLTFSLRATQSGQKYSVIFHDANNQLLGNPVSLGSVGGDPDNAAWKTYTIPLSTLSAQNSHVTGFVIQDATGHAQPTLYVDDIRIAGGSQVADSKVTTQQTSPPQSPPSSVSSIAGNPFAGTSLYVQPDNNAKKTADSYRASGDSSDAEQMMKIANSPTAIWAVGGDPTALVSDYTNKAAAAGAMGMVVVYNIPGRDCGQYSAGGTDYNSYKAWIDKMTAAIAGKKTAVILEPDALGLDCLQNDNTYTLLSYAVDTLSAHPTIAVYIEASSWVSADTMAQRLNKVHIDKARGFAVNVSGFNTTDSMVQYGNSVSDKVGGKPFVIDTSRNGNGPYDQSQTDPWCNPPGRALGAKPSATTGQSHVDAYLWLKVPGESDGTCRGGPSAGTWWPEYALGLAQRAAY